MKTALTINTGERIFLVHYHFEMGRVDMCNLHQLEGLVKAGNEVKLIQHFWNGKFTRISKKDLRAMLQSMGHATEFLTLI